MPDLPVSSVPAAFDRDHLYSPTADVVAWNIDYRAGDAFEPMPSSRSFHGTWGEWWRTEANVETPDFLGLKPGDVITIQQSTPTPGSTVIETCRFGALVRYPLPVREDADPGTEPATSERYVCRRNHLGYWY